MQQGLYEQLITKLVTNKLNEIDREKFYIKETLIDKAEAGNVLSKYLTEVIRLALNLVTGEDSLEKQISLTNKVIRQLSKELENEDFEDMARARKKKQSELVSKKAQRLSTKAALTAELASLEL